MLPIADVRSLLVQTQKSVLCRDGTVSWAKLLTFGAASCAATGDHGVCIEADNVAARIPLQSFYHHGRGTGSILVYCVMESTDFSAKTCSKQKWIV